MTRDEETLFIRFLQDADKDVLDKHLTLTNRENFTEKTRLTFQVTKDQDTGHLWLEYRNDDQNILAAEMNVNFPTMIGLNRSPLELRILTEHVLALYKDAPIQQATKQAEVDENPE